MKKFGTKLSQNKKFDMKKKLDENRLYSKFYRT